MESTFLEPCENWCSICPSDNGRLPRHQDRRFCCTAFLSNCTHLQMPAMHDQVLKFLAHFWNSHFHWSSRSGLIFNEFLPYLNCLHQHFIRYLEGTASSWTANIHSWIAFGPNPYSVRNFVMDQNSCLHMTRLIYIVMSQVSNRLSWKCTHNMQWRVRTGYN
jgi:hypothetical protein